MINHMTSFHLINSDFSRKSDYRDYHDDVDISSTIKEIQSSCSSNEYNYIRCIFILKTIIITLISFDEDMIIIDNQIITFRSS